MNRRAVAAIVRKDLTSVLRTNGVRIPLILAPVVILVVLPVILVGSGPLLFDNPNIPVDAAPLVDRFTPEFQEQATGVTGAGQWAVFALEFFLAPLYLLVPLIVATVIAADSFAGERERGTLEALLHTPTSDEDLLAAKLLAAWLPAVVVGLLGFVLYSIVANTLAWPYLHRIFFPNAVWIALALWVTPAVAALGLGMMVYVSSRVDSLQAAHQIGSLVVMPVILLIIAQVSGVFLLELDLVLTVGALLWTVDACLLWLAGRTFRRSRLAVRL